MSHPSERDAELCGSRSKTARTGWNQSLSYSNSRKVVGNECYRSQLSKDAVALLAMYEEEEMYE